VAGKPIQNTWTAARTKGGLSIAGGQIVLTDDALVFSPWDLNETKNWLAREPSEIEPSTGDTNRFLPPENLLEPVAVPFREIERAEILNKPSLLRPPSARLHLRSGEHFDVGILASPFTPNFRAANQDAFNEWLEAVERHLPSRQKESA
jgi:hypothetical protein